MTEFELFQSLRPLYPAAEYALLPQVANGTGSRCNRHADALALSLWPSRGIYLHGFEIKSYRGDWLREMRNPAKADEIAKHCHFWWIVIPDETIAPMEELPPDWGLMIHGESGLKKKTHAKLREATPLDIGMVAGILRKSQEVTAPATAIADARAEGYNDGKKAGESSAKANTLELQRIMKTVAAFEQASGINLRTAWEGPAKIGEAVKAILHGTVENARRDMVGVARRFLVDVGELEADGKARD